MKVKSESEGAQSCLTLQDPMDCSLPGSSVLGIFQARVLEWGAIAFSAPLAGGLAHRGSRAGVVVGGTWHRVGLGPSRGGGAGWGPEARGQL